MVYWMGDINKNTVFKFNGIMQIDTKSYCKYVFILEDEAVSMQILIRGKEHYL